MQIKLLSRPLQDDRKTRMDTKLCITKQRQTQKPVNCWSIQSQDLD